MRGRGFTPTVLMALATRGNVITKPETMSAAGQLHAIGRKSAGCALLHPSRCFPMGPATFFPLFVDALSIFFVVALPPRKHFLPVSLVPARIISTALFPAFLTAAFVIGNTMLGRIANLAKV